MSADLPADYSAAASRLPYLFKVEEWMDYVLDTYDEPTPAELEVMLSRVGRNNEPALLFDLYYAGLLTAEAATRCVASAWSIAEYPQDLIPDDTWRALFDLAGYTVEGQPAERPTEPLRLYRGSPEQFRDRWSWTDDRDSAERFATGGLRARLPGTIWTAQVEPWRLFCHIHEHSRGESEYVLDTRGLVIERADSTPG